MLPVIREIQKEGVTSAAGIAAALNKRGITTARGKEWRNVQVAAVLARAANELELARAQPARKSGAKLRSKASEMAGQAIDLASDESATDDERASRKRRLLKGPKEFRDIRGDLSRAKS
jgi:hypothetical protein